MVSGDLSRSLLCQGGRRDNRSRGRQLYSPRNLSRFRLGRFSDVDNLHQAYRMLEEDGGHGAGPDRVTFRDISASEVFAGIRAVSASIREGTYSPFGVRRVRIPKGNGRYRELRLQNLMDRMVSKALHEAIQPWLQQSIRTYGRGSWEIFVAMERQMSRRRAFVLAIDDIRDCFPSAPREATLTCIRERFRQPDLQQLIERIIRGQDDRGWTGLDQGSPLSPSLMELLLHHFLDTEVENRYHGFPLLLRYVDNLTCVCRSEREGNEILARMGEILNTIGFELKGQDGAPQDVRDPNYGTKVLGMIPRWKSGQLTWIIPEDSFASLEQDLSCLNQEPTTSQNIENSVTGWIQAYGPALTNSVAPRVIDRLMEIMRRNGFRTLPRRKLVRASFKARKAWDRCRNR